MRVLLSTPKDKRNCELFNCELFNCELFNCELFNCPGIVSYLIVQASLQSLCL